MAGKSVTQSVVTDAVEFGAVPVHKRNMFSVLEGMPADIAISHAACIVDGLRELANDGVQANGIGAGVAWLMSENLDAVFALLTSVEASVEKVTA